MNPSSELRLFYSGWPATDVTWTPKNGASKTERAILDQPSQVILNGEVVATDYGLRYPASNFPNVRKGDSFFVKNVGTFTASEHAQSSVDGLENTVSLARSA